MVLTDREIQAAIENKQILIDPLPNELAYSSTSLDLGLSKFIRVWRTEPVQGVDQIVCPATDGYRFSDFAKNYSDAKEIGPEGYVVNPGGFLLGWTEETVELPICGRLAARVEGKSSLSRLGIGIHVTAPTIHAGFKGPIQLEICNHGSLKVKLIPGMPVCQLIFDLTLGTPEKGYAGQFQAQAKK
ncbi:MAG TPA: dCTP deaminase [Terriglobia bacterium]|nr:dCTP deaminase [Terriglobia bacterium]